MQQRRLSAGLSYDRGGMVAADIVEGAQGAVIAANHNDGFTGDEGRNELPWRLQLIGARDQLPGFAEYAQALQVRDAWIDVPSCGNG